jgi:hypothetical protein
VAVKDAILGITCNILLPSSSDKLFYLNGRYYEILSPGTSLMRKGTGTVFMQGMCLAREAGRRTKN